MILNTCCFRCSKTTNQIYVKCENWKSVCYGFLRTFQRMRPQVIPNCRMQTNEKIKWSDETHISPIVHCTCGLHALEVTNLNVVASNLLRACFKSQSLPNSIIFITEHLLHMFLTLCSELKF